MNLASLTACSRGSCGKSGGSPSWRGRGRRGLVVEAPATMATLRPGDSVAVNGVCLTAESVEQRAVTVHAVPETLRRTTLGSLARGDAVNLEPALQPASPSEATTFRAMSTASGASSRWRRRARASGRDRGPRRRASVLRREGLHRGGRGLADGRRALPSTAHSGSRSFRIRSRRPRCPSSCPGVGSTSRSMCSRNTSSASRSDESDDAAWLRFPAWRRR